MIAQNKKCNHCLAYIMHLVYNLYVHLVLIYRYSWQHCLQLSELYPGQPKSRYVQKATKLFQNLLQSSLLHSSQNFFHCQNIFCYILRNSCENPSPIFINVFFGLKMPSFQDGCQSQKFKEFYKFLIRKIQLVTHRQQKFFK